MNLPRRVEVTTTKKITLLVTEKEFREMFNLPKDAEISVRVPGGADWSNMKLVLGEDVEKIEISWTETKAS